MDSGVLPPHSIAPLRKGNLIACDIGTTTVVCFLLDGNSGKELAKRSRTNPQIKFGADVITRIQYAVHGRLDALTTAIRNCMADLIREVCFDAGISTTEIGMLSIVGNPAMQQLFLGLSVSNLACIPFAPVLKEAKVVSCKNYLPVCENADMLIIPDISGYVGADTIGCILSTELYHSDKNCLLVDIGTNGEMVLGNRRRMVACSTAAGPALEGANIQFGMRGADGAIDHVWLENGAIKYSVIGGGEAIGICGSGIVDAIAVGLRTKGLDKRGRIRNSGKTLQLTKEIYLTQEDIRQVQLAKGAIYAGISLMANYLQIKLDDIQTVKLAGAFGNYLNPENACRIGLLPEILRNRIELVGNAAGSGAKMLACDQKLLILTQELAQRIEFIELADLPEFKKTFALGMTFREEPE